MGSRIKKRRGLGSNQTCVLYIGTNFWFCSYLKNKIPWKLKFENLSTFTIGKLFKHLPMKFFYLDCNLTFSKNILTNLFILGKTSCKLKLHLGSSDNQSAMIFFFINMVPIKAWVGIIDGLIEDKTFRSGHCIVV